MSLPERDSANSLTIDQIFDLLGDPTRRRALVALWQSDRAVSLDELAKATAARADDVAPAEVTTDRRERTASALYHNHLPRLADADVVEYDPAESRVEVTETVEEFEPFFEVMDVSDAMDRPFRPD